MTYLIKYLGEIEFIYETVLGYVSRDQMGSFEAKKQSRKSHAWAPLIDTESRLIDMESPWEVRIKNLFGKLRLKFKLLKSLILSLIYAYLFKKMSH